MLEQQLQEYVAPENSMLAMTLAKQVGESSPLFRILSPTDSEGMVKVLEGQLQKVLADSKEEFDRALDPATPDSPISRFLNNLKEELRGSGVALDEKLNKALSALDSNDEDSLLSKLVRDTQIAQESLLKAINPESPDSPMAILDKGLRKTIETHAATQRELLESQRERQVAFEKQVHEALAEMKVARKNRNADVGMFVMASSRAGDQFPIMSRHGADVLVQWDMDALRQMPTCMPPSCLRWGLSPGPERQVRMDRSMRLMTSTRTLPKNWIESQKHENSTTAFAVAVKTLKQS